MAANTDILLVNNDLLIQSGDLVTGYSDQQHIEDTINAFPGWWKENPLDGVGIGGYLNAPDKTQEIIRAIRLHLTNDGYQVGNPTVTLDAAGNMVINPDATKV
jgi:hypothetical protein